MGVVGGVKFVAADSEGWRMRVGQENLNCMTHYNLVIVHLSAQIQAILLMLNKCLVCACLARYTYNSVF